MMIRIPVLAVLILTMTYPAIAELELDENGRPVKNMLEAFEPYTGRWSARFTTKAGGLAPEVVTITGFQEGAFILDKTMFMIRAVGELDGQKAESIYLYGFDPIEASYCCWHYIQGAVAFKYRVEWGDDGKSYKQVSIGDEESEVTMRTDVRLIEGRTIAWESKVVSDEGELLIDQVGQISKDPGVIEFPAPAIAEDDKLAMYRGYEGQWDSVTKGEVTQFVDEPYEVTGPWVQSTTLGGDMVEMWGSMKMDEQSYKYLWLYMYDDIEQSYVAWFHDSRGYHTKSYGNWSEENNQMTWTLDDPERHGVMVNIVDDLSDPEKIAFRFKMESGDGRLIMSEEGYATRSGQAD